MGHTIPSNVILGPGPGLVGRAGLDDVRKKYGSTHLPLGFIPTGFGLRPRTPSTRLKAHVPYPSKTLAHSQGNKELEHNANMCVS